MGTARGGRSQRAVHGGGAAKRGSAAAPSPAGGLWSSLALKVAPATDPLEHEADRAADRVLAGGTADVAPAASPLVRRKCAACAAVDDELRVHRKCAACDAMSHGGGAAAGLVASALSDRGAPLDGATRGFFEPRFGRDLSDVRIHTGAGADASAHAIQALAYTAGSHIAFAGGQFSPGTQAGRRLLAHELAHVAQETPVVRRQMAPAPAPAPAPPSVDPATRGDFPLVMSGEDPALFVVPTYVTRAQIAQRLFGDATLVRSFEYARVQHQPVLENDPALVVAALEPQSLTPEAAAVLRAALEDRLPKDVKYVTGKLSERIIGAGDEAAVTGRTLQWSDRYHLLDASGTSYFERFLAALDSVTLIERGLFSDTSKSALQWLLIETEDTGYDEQIRKAMALRSRRATSYRIDDLDASGYGDFRRFAVIGRFYYYSGSSLQLRVIQTIAWRHTYGEAERAALHHDWTGPRAIVPSSRGYFAYAVEYGVLALVRPPNERDGRFHWYYPGTRLVRASAGEEREQSPGYNRATQELRFLYDRKRRMLAGELPMDDLAQVDAQIGDLIGSLRGLGIALETDKIYEAVESGRELRQLGGELRVSTDSAHVGDRVQVQVAFNYVPLGEQPRVMWLWRCGEEADRLFGSTPSDILSTRLGRELDEEFWERAPSDCRTLRITARVLFPSGKFDLAAPVIHLAEERIPNPLDLNAEPKQLVPGTPVEVSLKAWAPVSQRYRVDWFVDGAADGTDRPRLRRSFGRPGIYDVKAHVSRVHPTLRLAGALLRESIEIPVAVQSAEQAAGPMFEHMATKGLPSLAATRSSLVDTIAKIEVEADQGGANEAYLRSRLEMQRRRLASLDELAPAATEARDLPADVNTAPQAGMYTTAVPAVLVVGEDAEVQPVSLFLTTRFENGTWRARLIDMSGADVYKFDGDGATPLNAALAAFADWKDDNPYPPYCTVVYQFAPPGWSFPATFSTTTTWKKAKPWIDGILAIGGLIIGAILLLVPEPTGLTKGLALVILTASVARSTYQIIENIDLGMDPFDSRNVLEAVSIVGSLAGLGGSVLRGAGLRAVRPLTFRVGNWLVLGSTASDVGAVVFATSQGIASINAIQADPTLDDAQKSNAVFSVVSRLMVQGLLVIGTNRDLFKGGLQRSDLFRTDLPTSAQAMITQGTRLDIELELKRGGATPDDMKKFRAMSDSELLEHFLARGRTPALNLPEPGVLDHVTARLHEITLEGGPLPQETRGAGAAVVDVAGYSGPPELRAVSAKATDVLGVGAPVPHAGVPEVRTLPAPKNIGGGGGRDFPGSHINDVEIKLLEYISARLPPGAKGTVHVYTVRTKAGGSVVEPLPACAGCTNAAFHFKQQHPDVDLVFHAAPHRAPTIDLSAAAGTPPPRVDLVIRRGADGHELRAGSDGIIVCSDCTKVRELYKQELDDSPDLRKRLEDTDTDAAAAALSGDVGKAQKAADEGWLVRAELDDLKFEALKTTHGVTGPQAQLARMGGVDAPTFESMLKAGIPPDDAALIAISYKAPGAAVAAKMADAGSPVAEITQAIQQMSIQGKLGTMAATFGGGSKTSVIGTPRDSHEALQGMDFARRRADGGQVKFGPESLEAVEGVYLVPGGKPDGEFHISMKAFPSDSAKNVAESIQSNANKVIKYVTDGKPTVLFAYSKLRAAEVKGALDAAAGTPGHDFHTVFHQITVVCADGVVEGAGGTFRLR